MVGRALQNPNAQKKKEKKKQFVLQQIATYLFPMCNYMSQVYTVQMSKELLVCKPKLLITDNLYMQLYQPGGCTFSERKPLQLLQDEKA